MDIYYFREVYYRVDPKVLVLSSIHAKYDGSVVAIGVGNVEFKVIYPPTSIDRTYWEF